jgi:hypothetical protein
MKKNAGGGYDSAVELAKGATLEAAAYDKTQKAAVIAGKVTVGGNPGIAEISGIAAGPIPEAGLEGTVDLWLSIFRFKRPDGTTNHVAGLNLPVKLASGQGAIDTAKALADFINASNRPYKAAVKGDREKAAITIVYTENEKK